MKIFDVPDTKDECLLPSKKAKSLNAFATFFDVVGIILAVINVLIGIGFAVGGSQLQYYLNFYMSDIFSILCVVVGAISGAIVYVVFHFKASLLRGLAETIQNTYITANFAAYNTYNPEQPKIVHVEEKRPQPGKPQPTIEPVKPAPVVEEIKPEPVVAPIVVEEKKEEVKEFSIPNYELPKEETCPTCGSKILPTDMFCIKCGTKLK